MTGYALEGIVIAAMVAFLIAVFAIVLMIRDNALKFRKAIERDNKIAREMAEQPMAPILGSHVKFQDAKGKEHDALVIAVHNPRMLTLAIADNDNPNIDQYFRDIERGASVPHVTMPPVSRFSYEYIEEELKPYGVPEQSNDLHHHSYVN